MLTGSCLCQTVAYEVDADPGALPLPDMPEGPCVRIFQRDASSASVVSMGQRRRVTEFVRIVTGQIPPLLLSMWFPRHGRAGEPADCSFAAGLPRHANA
jgi:hypothetical protein